MEESLTLNITQEIHVKASLEATFEALLEQMGPANETGNGTPMPMKLEAWPGGRWYRDLGNNEGHFWGHVQAIKPPTLVEICGPLFASHPLVSNVQYRLKAQDGGTLIEFKHAAVGYLPEDIKSRVNHGWASILDRVRAAAEKGGTRRAQ
jgi:uncharacterized protein YndB with AHSA1/START domain